MENAESVVIAAVLAETVGRLMQSPGYFQQGSDAAKPILGEPVRDLIAERLRADARRMIACVGKSVEAGNVFIRCRDGHSRAGQRQDCGGQRLLGRRQAEKVA